MVNPRDIAGKRRRRRRMVNPTDLAGNAEEEEFTTLLKIATLESLAMTANLTLMSYHVISDPS